MRQPALPGLEPGDVAVLAGAGVSIPTGIASGQMFNAQILSALVEGAEELRRGVRFEQLIQVLRDTIDPELLVLSYLEQAWTPTSLHLWLAEAIRDGAMVLTTNLDALIESAFHKRFRRLPDVVFEPDHYLGCLLSRPAAPLFKLHGTLRRPDYLEKHFAAHDLEGREEPFRDLEQRAIETVAATIDAIGRAEQAPRSARGPFVLPRYITAALERVLAGRDLVVIGYSGSDDFDIKPSLRLLREHYRRVFWIDHRDGNLRVRRSGDMWVIRGPTTVALGALFPKRKPADATPRVNPARQFSAFCKEWQRRIGLTPARRALASGAILEQAGRFYAALKTWDQALDRIPEDDQMLHVQMHLRIGEAFLHTGNPFFAQEMLTIAARGAYRLRDIPMMLATNVRRAEALLEWSDHAGEPRADAEGRRMLAQVAGDTLRVRDELGQRQAFKHEPAELRLLLAIERIYERVSVQTGLAAARAARRRGAAQATVRELTGFDLTPVEMLSDLSLLAPTQADKFLYADLLYELALAHLIAGDRRAFALRALELLDLCRLLAVRYPVAMLHLETALFLSDTEPAVAEELFRDAQVAFGSEGYPIGHAYAREGEAVLRACRGDARGVEEQLEETAETLADLHVRDERVRVLGETRDALARAANRFFLRKRALRAALAQWRTKVGILGFDSVGISAWSVPVHSSPTAALRRFLEKSHA